MMLKDLKPLLDKTVTLRMTDGEVAKVRVCVVDDEYEDIIVDIVETSSPERYRAPRAVYTFAAMDIATAELSE